MSEQLDSALVLAVLLVVSPGWWQAVVRSTSQITEDSSPTTERVMTWVARFLLWGWLFVVALAAFRFGQATL